MNLHFVVTEEEQDVRSSPVMRGIRKVLPMTDHFAGDRFLYGKNQRGKSGLFGVQRRCWEFFC